MDRMVLFGILEEGRRAGKQRWYCHLAKDRFAYSALIEIMVT
jgi:hypothetical protein